MITVLIATRNGAKTLPALLESLANCDTDSEQWQLIIVDNGSTDGTAELLANAKSILPLLVLNEPRPGKNTALNKALRHVNGELVVFTDDDVLVPPDFIKAYAQLAQYETRFSIFGGAIDAKWPEKVDRCLLNAIPLNVAFAVTDTDRGRGSIKASDLYGPNVAIRRQVFEQGLRFNESVGPNGSNYMMGSETEFLARAEKAGFAAFNDPSIVVQHRIEQGQLTFDWLFSRAQKSGRALMGEQLREHGRAPDVRTVLDYPTWALSGSLQARVRGVVARICGNREEAHRENWHAGFLLGYAREFQANACQSVAETPR